MIYQVLSRPRTGSSIIYQYAWHNSECRGTYKGTHLRLGEYFNTQDTLDEYETKFKFLETGKEDNRHYCLKVHLGQIRDVPRIINYFKDYHVCITERNPWDSYLSYMFCELHDWKISHKDQEGNWSTYTKEKGKVIVDIDEENFVLYVSEETIEEYIKVYKRDLNLIEEIKQAVNSTVFDYDNLNLKVLFNKEITMNTVKNNINYEAHIPFGLVDYYKTIFDKYLNE